MSPALRKLNLTAHVASSVGWLGAVASFLLLSIAGLTSQDADTVRGAYLAMNLIGQSVIVPLSFAALLTGIIQSLGTQWGLFRYYWVLTKFTLTIGATILLMLHQFEAVAEAARRVSISVAGTLPEIGQLRIQLLADAGLALLVLAVITALSTYKPWGLTPYGRRQQKLQERGAPAEIPVPASAVLTDSGDNTARDGLPLGLKIFLTVAGLIVVLFAVLHHTGGVGIHHH